MLDHAVYPHIFDLIVDSADNDCKIALRAVSRDLKRRVDAKLFEHLELDAHGYSNFEPLYSMLSPHGKLPGPPFPSTLDDFERDPGVWRQRLELARVLDLNANLRAEGYEDDPPLFRAALSNLKAIRRRPDESWMFTVQVPTFIDVLTLDRDGTLDFDYPTMSPFDTNTSSTKNVLHIRYDPCYQRLQELALGFEGRAPNVVFIFSPVASKPERR
jgi:hypothetical protein